MDYKFAADVKKNALTMKKVRTEGPDSETVEVPCLTLTLELVDERAISVSARLAAFHGQEVVVVIDGDGRQLRLD